MTINKELNSDLAVAPGKFLAEILENRRMSQAELARRMGRPPQAINEIIKGEKEIIPETAIQLEQVVGVPAHVWTGLESDFQLVQARVRDERQTAREIGLLPYIPYPQLVKLGVVQTVHSRAEKVRQLKSFFGVASLENLEQINSYRLAFRVSRNKKASPYALAAWLRCGEIQASNVAVKPFSLETLKKKLKNIRRLTNEEPKIFVPALKRTLADCGVALVVLPHLTKTYAHGATFWLHKDKAVVMITLRGSWADIFWFSLFHELGHLLFHNSRMTFIEGMMDTETAKQEEEADLFAANTLIPTNEHLQIKALRHASDEKIVACAKNLGIHPGVLVGRLQHDGVIPKATSLNSLRMRLKWSE